MRDREILFIVELQEKIQTALKKKASGKKMNLTLMYLR